MIAILILSGLAIAAAVSIWLVVRDVRNLHKQKKELADTEMSAAGASPAAMAFYGSIFSH